MSSSQAGVLALDASYGETRDDVAAAAEKAELTLPIAINSGGEAADIFGARHTTTTVVIDAAGVLRYRGQFAGDQPFARDALQAVLAKRQVPVKETREKG